jgi:hypothetical protein
MAVPLVLQVMPRPLGKAAGLRRLRPALQVMPRKPARQDSQIGCPTKTTSPLRKAGATTADSQKWLSHSRYRFGKS